MAVVSVREIWEGRKATVDWKGRREYTRVFRVLTSSTLDDPVQVGNTLGVPRLFDIYSVPGGADSGAIVTKITPVQDSQSPCVWLVTIEYSTESGDQSRYDQNPLNRPPKIRWTQQKFTRTIDRDTDDNAIVNSAGEPIQNVEIDDTRLILTYERNEPSFDPGLAYQYSNTINADSFFGANKYQAKCESIEGELQAETDFYFWAVTYVFQFRFDTGLGAANLPPGAVVANSVGGWQRTLLDQGFSHLDAGSKLQVNRDSSFTPYSHERLLDGTGKILASNASPIWLFYNVYESLPFAPLNIFPP